jgi:hypothetical protein
VSSNARLSSGSIGTQFCCALKLPSGEPAQSNQQSFGLEILCIDTQPASKTQMDLDQFPSRTFRNQRRTFQLV